jgi:hypothetical protein
LDVIDAIGRLVNSTHIYPVTYLDASDRDFFQHFARLDDHGLFVSEPVISRITGTPAIFLVRRVNAPDGTFLGLVMGEVDVPYLTKFYQAISTRPGQSVTLLRRDGSILVRYPDPTNEVGGVMPNHSPWYERVRIGGGTYTSPGYLLNPQLSRP